MNARSAVANKTISVALARRGPRTFSPAGGDGLLDQTLDHLGIKDAFAGLHDLAHHLAGLLGVRDSHAGDGLAYHRADLVLASGLGEVLGAERDLEVELGEEPGALVAQRRVLVARLLELL